jgi:hypothetical protein
VLSKLGESVPLAGLTRVVMLLTGIVGPSAGAVCAWGITSVFKAQDRLEVATHGIEVILAGAQVRAELRDQRIDHLEAAGARQAVAVLEHDKEERAVFDNHEKRISALELAQLAAQEARLRQLEEPAVTKRLNRREAVKR